MKTNGDLVYFYTTPINGVEGSGTNSGNGPKFLCNLRDVERVLRGSKETSFTIVTNDARIMLQGGSAETFREWFYGLQKLREKLMKGGWEGKGDGTDSGEGGGEGGGGEAGAVDQEEEGADPAVNLLFHTSQFEGSETKKISAITFIDNVAIVDEFFDKFDRNYMTQAFSQAATSPDHLMQAHEVVSAMQVRVCEERTA